MDARWMPLLAAGLGVLGGIGGAFIGGNLANEGAERRFESERAAAIQDVRRDAYANFLGSAEEFALTYGTRTTEEERKAAATRFIVARARAILVAGDVPAVVEAAEAVSATLILPSSSTYDEEAYEDAAKSFFQVARDDIRQAAE
jgi:hypothetical protein